MIVSFSPPLFVFSLLFSHHLRHEISHLFGGTFLHLARDVGVGSQREACVEVTEHTRYGFHVHAILECQGRECVSQVMKSQMLQSCILQNFLVDVDHRIWMIHLACFWGWEHPRIAGMLLVFCDQQIDGILRNRDFADGVFRFRAGDIGFAGVVASGLLADGNRLVFDVQVRPLERHQFAFAQSADELQIEHRQDTTLVGGCQIGLDLLWRQDLHFVLRDFGRNAVICRVSEDQALFDRAGECIVQHRVDAADRVRSAFSAEYLRCAV